ncbi:hypothetical protein ACFQ9H_20100 [Streptomyces sp. NPDC056517]|uniref:Vgb family protein n=1 Tax=Streptomyces sp. NPDC056517 TaxID=3345848 RepID=UPI00368F23C1
MAALDPLPAGTILVSDAKAFGCAGAVFRIDPVTGEQHTLAVAGDLQGATGIALEADGSVLISKDRFFPGTGVLLRLPAGTGTQTEVTSGGKFATPGAVAVEADGRILIADAWSGGFGAVLRVDPATGEQTVLSAGDGEGDSPPRPVMLCTAPDGAILVTEQNRLGGEDLSSRVVRVHPVTGARTTVTSGGELRSPIGVAVDGDGGILVADANAFAGFGGGVLRVDPVSGTQTTVSSGGGFVGPYAIAVEADGSLLVTDNDALNGVGTLFRVNPTTGEQQVLSSGGVFGFLTGVAVVPTYSG